LPSFGPRAQCIPAGRLKGAFPLSGHRLGINRTHRNLKNYPHIFHDNRSLDRRRREKSLILAASILASLIAIRAEAADLYWDGNGTGAAGAGTAPAGTWGSSNFWNTSSSGSGGALQSTTLATEDVFFSAGSDATGTYTVSVPNNDTVSANSVTVQEGNVTFDKSIASGSVINIGAGGITIDSGARLTMSGSKLSVALAAPQSWTNNSTNSFTVSVPVANGASLLTVSGTGNTSISGVIGSGSGGLTKSGSGTLTLSAANTYTGTTSVNAGTLQVQGGGLTATSTVQLTGGSLLLGASNVLNNSASVNLNGGTLGSSGFSEGAATTVGLGSLLLSSASAIDFGIGSVGTLTFAGGSYSAGTLSILNWTGAAGEAGADGTNDRLIFAGSNAARLAFLSAFNQSAIFFSGFGTGYNAIQFNANYFEIVPVPEPATTALVGALALCALIGCRERRRLGAAVARLKK
jgi:autotransporter-associated beta strand protein